MLRSRFHMKVVAVMMAVSFVFVTAPGSAAELTRAAAIGSVTSVGSVHLRGIRFGADGTLFSGDEIRSGVDGYAKVLIIGGHKLEVDARTELTIHEDGNAARVVLKSGNVGFTTGRSRTALTFAAGPYQVQAEKGASGHLSVVGTGSLGVRVLSGSIEVKGAKGTAKLGAGQERLWNFATGQSTVPLAQLASSVPMAVPAVPAMPQAQAGQGLTRAGWVAILATIGGAAAAIAIMATRGEDETDNSRQLALVQTLSSISTTATQVDTTATQVEAAASGVNSAIGASNASAAVKSQLQARASTLTSQAKASQTSIANLLTQVETLRDSLGNVDGSTTAAIESQIAAILSSVNSEVNKLNQYIADLNKLVADANAEVPNLIVAPTIQPVAPAQSASASNP